MKKKIGSTGIVCLGFLIGAALIFGFLQLFIELIHSLEYSYGIVALASLPGGVAGVIIAFLLAKNQRQNQELKSNELKLRTLIDLSLDGIYLENELGEILDCNTVGHEMFGYTREEMLKLSIRDLVPVEFAGLLPEIIPQEMATGDVYLERENRRKDGTLFPTEISTKFVELNGERRLIAYVRDISERKETESILKSTIETKDKLFSIIGHDLKGSLNAILGFSDMLITDLESYSEDEKRQIMKYIRGSADQANGLLVNLLNWAFIQTEKIYFSPHMIDANLTVEKVFSQISELAEGKSIILHNKVEAGSKVFADEEMLKTILRNLISNAIKYSPAGNSIEIGAKPEAGKLSLSISDQGIGMTREIIDNLFIINKTKIQPGTNHEVGTGLGLIICKEFAEKNGGELRVESQPGHGSTFFVSLPANDSN